jgi:hypothetical protein
LAQESALVRARVPDSARASALAQESAWALAREPDSGQAPAWAQERASWVETAASP